MKFFRRGERDTGAPTTGVGMKSCQHLLLVPHWDSPANIGNEELASGYRCNACDEHFTREEEAILRATDADRVRRGLQERANLRAQYPRRWHLADGREVELRHLDGSSRDAFLRFTRSLPQDDMLFLREDLASDAVVDALIAGVEAGTDFALVARDRNEVAGYASLHGEPMRWTRNVGEIRIIVAEAYRGSGLGGRLAREVIDAAPNFGSRKITAQMTVDQTGARAAFERLGFQEEATLTGWVTDRRGLPRDLLIMALDLAAPQD